MRQDQILTVVILAVKKYIKKALTHFDKVLKEESAEIESKLMARVEESALSHLNQVGELISEQGQFNSDLSKRLNEGLDSISDIVSREVSERGESIKSHLQESLTESLNNVEWEDFYGRDGEDGLSAYEVWRESNEGSVDDFFTYLKGDKGDDGSDGVSLEWDIKDDRVGVRLEGDTDYTYTPNLTGRSIEYKVLDDRIGIRQEGESSFSYTESLKGERGEDGEDGKSLYFKVEGDRIGVRREGESEWRYTDVLTGRDGRDGDSLDFIVDGDKVGIKRQGDTQYQYTQSLKGRKGDKGEDGGQGVGLKFKVEADRIGIKREGEHRYTYTESLIGDKPDHRWVGTQLQFEKPDGSWGKPVDLRGARGGGGGGKGGSSDFDPDKLPVSPEGSEMQEVIVKVGDSWVRMPFNQFLTYLPTYTPPIIKVGDADAVAGDNLVVSG